MIPATPPASGLCGSCTHARITGSARGSSFTLCGLSKADARFPKYPRLPVLACSGFVTRDGTND